MTVIQWILSILFALPVLLNLHAIFDGEWIVKAILLAIATILVLPPLDHTFADKLAILKSKALRIFLAVVLATAGLVASTNPALSLNNIAICAPANVSDCQAGPTLFAAGIQPITVQTLLEEDSAANVKSIVIDITQEDGAGQTSSIVNQTLKINGTTLQADIKLEDIALDVGVYNLEVTPQGAETQNSASKKATFVVLPSDADVTKRISTGHTFSKFEQTITELRVCPDPGGEEHCEESQTTVPSNIPVLADAIMQETIANYTWLGKDPAITFTWREYANDESADSENAIPEIVFQDTIALDNNISLFGYPIGVGEGGLPPGKYDVVVVLETANSQPLQMPFTVTESSDQPTEASDQPADEL